MNKMVKRFLVVMMSAFVFANVISIPVLATETESEIIEETVVETEEVLQEETVEPTEEIAIPEEEASAEAPVEEIAVSTVEEVTSEEMPTGKEAFEIVEEEATEISPIDLSDSGDEEVYIINAEGDDPTINAGKTVLDTDGDGIYELALSIKATSQSSTETKATKQNVVMIIDVSGSMGNNNSWVYYDTYTYNADTYGEYRYYNSSQNTNTRLYYGTYRTGGYNSTAYTGWYYGGYDQGGRRIYASAYNGPVYAYETRLHGTQRAAGLVVDALLANNNNTDGITDLFEITVIKFANLTASGNNNGTETIIRDSTNATAIKNAINGLTSGGGTNWEAALNLGLTEANYFKNTDPSRDLENPEITSVIFLTDGFPTYYVNDNNGTQGGSGQENANNIATSYTQARPSARSIVSNGYNLYNIFAFGSDTQTYNGNTGFAYLRGLTNYAYGSGNTDNFGQTAITQQYAYNAKSTDDLVGAFDAIISHFTDNVGFAGVNLTDGVSLGATSTSVAVNGTAHEDSMRYTVRNPNGRIVYTVKFDNGAATFTIYNADGSQVTLTDNTADTVTTEIGDTTIESTVYSVTVGEGDEAQTYMMSPAEINPDTGMVTWDLAGLGILENGYTYTVAFDVWPNQLAYDIAADLNNGIYPDIDAALTAYNVTDETERRHIKEAIVQEADGSYAIYTNYAQSIDYYPATSETDEDGNVTWTYGNKQTQELPHPDPIPLQGSLLPLHKAWETDLSQSELNELLWENGEVDGTSTGYQITLYIWKADTREALDALINAEGSTPYITEVLGWDAEENKYVWDRDVAVAPGTMVNLAEAEELGFDITDESKRKEFTTDSGDVLPYYVIESGHYYYVTEDGSDLHYELETDIYHPMIVDGTLYNVFFGEGRTVERMDPMYAVVATNTLKGGLNIHKIVSTTQVSVEDGSLVGVTEPVDGDGIETVTDEFTFEIKIWKEDEQGNKSAVYTYDDQIEIVEGGTATTKSGSIGYRVFSDPSWDAENGEIVYGSQIRGAILTSDSPYAELAGPVFATIADNETTIVLTMPANGEIRLVNMPSGTKYTVREIEDPTHTYTYAATESSILPVKDGDEAVVTTGNTVSGTIAGNKANVETYYNWAAAFYVYHSSDATIEKISFADSRVSGEYDAETGEYTYTFNIVDEVKDAPEETGKPSVSDFLYGGYYKAYAGTTATDAEIIALTYTEKDDGTFWADNSANDDEYTYAYIKSKNMKAWTYADAYLVNGLEMNPEVNKVYYLKEVPNGYLRPYLHYTYNTSSKIVQAMWLISDIDDANYEETGFFVVDDTGNKASVVTSLTVKTANGSSSVKLTPEQVFKTKGVQRGYLTYINASNKNPYNYLVANATYNTTEYWITPDELVVEGVTTRTISIGNKKITGEGKLTATDVDGLSVVTKKD